MESKEGFSGHLLCQSETDRNGLGAYQSSPRTENGLTGLRAVVPFPSYSSGFNAVSSLATLSWFGSSPLDICFIRLFSNAGRPRTVCIFERCAHCVWPSLTLCLMFAMMELTLAQLCVY